jgi:putative transposase
MARAPRFIPPGTLVEITMRTNAARLHLRPSPELNARIEAILAVALFRYPVLLHAIVFLSNHWHALVTPCDAQAMRRFLQFVNGNIAKAAKEINGVKGKVWQSRASLIPVLDDAAQLSRLRYLLAHGTKEHLVGSPLEWPGVTSARALATGEKLYGTWVDRTRRKRLSRSGRTPHPSEYSTTYPIELSPLPVHDKLSPSDRQQEVRAMLAEIVAEHPGPHMGVEAVLAQDPEAEPFESKNTRAPAVHTTSQGLKEKYLILRGAFRRAYRDAARAHRENPTSATWPMDSFLPPSIFFSPGDSPPLLSMLV